MEQEIEERVVKIITANLGVNPQGIQLADSLTDDLGADSLDHVEIIMSMEAEFEIGIIDEDVEQFKTVEDFCNHIAEVL